MIENAKITKVELTMGEHGCLTFWMHLKGDGWGQGFGGLCLGHGYLDSDHFDSSEKLGVYLMKIMDTVGVESFNDMVGKYIRIEKKSRNEVIKRIGNIIKDKWFDVEDFFSEE